MLVSYSDSEGSEDERIEKPVPKSVSKQTPAQTGSNFAIDKSTGKIKVNLQSKPDPSSNATHEDEPAAKRPRLGGGSGAFSGFNAMLPAPKRDNLPPAQNGGSKAPARKVFSLRTGAEPAFSRESDAELRELFAEQDANNGVEAVKKDVVIPSNIPKPSFAKPAPPAPAGKPMLFKPLSVARNNNRKKKPSNAIAAPLPQMATQPVKSAAVESPLTPEPPKKKINLFSAETDSTPPVPISNEDDEIIEDLGPAESDDSLDTFMPDQTFTHTGPQSQSLDSIASDLNLSAAEKRQLFGRSGKAQGSSAINVVNFNTDAEYAANQQLIANGETVQHNPVRAIASGKHSLKSLISSAANQKEALEESFASGKRNKKEAGSKYGW